MNNTVEKKLNIKIEKEVVGAECGEKKKEKKRKQKRGCSPSCVLRISN